MTEVSFQEETSIAPVLAERPFIVRLLFSTGLVTTEDQARYVLLAAAALTIVLAISIAVFSLHSASRRPPPLWIPNPPPEGTDTR